MVFQLFTGSHVRNPPYVKQQQQQQIPQQAPINRRMGGKNLFLTSCLGPKKKGFWPKIIILGG